MTPQTQNLNIRLNKVKGHQDEGNIQVDEIAKKGALGSNYFDIKKLLSHDQTILWNHEHVIFDYQKHIFTMQMDEQYEICRDKSSLHTTKD